MVGFASSENSSSRRPKLLWRTWIVRALVTAAVEPGVGTSQVRRHGGSSAIARLGAGAIP